MKKQNITNQIKNKKDCCGCGACVSACSAGCLSFDMDQEGFEYPKVNENACLHCGKCAAVCPFFNIAAPACQDVHIYGAWSKNEQIRFRSSSGGIFSELARYIISLNGVVFGAALEKDGTVAHHYAETESQLARFCKSKYVQSHMGACYEAAKRFLEEEKTVLFSGTPCQIAGLHGFLRKNYPNLYTVDVICVGVPSPKVWKAYVKEVEQENKGKPRSIIFRHKEIDGAVLKAGDRNLTIKVEFEDGRALYQYFDKNEFFGGFLSKLFLRPSCADCKVKKFAAGSDMQLGDFWEIERIYPEVLPLSDEKRKIPFGVSEVLIHTQKGRQLFQAIKENIVSFEADLYLVKKAQADMNWFLIENSSQQHWNRDVFFEEFAEDPGHVKEIIRRNLGLRGAKDLTGKSFGMWGSFGLRETLRLMTNHGHCQMVFQFRDSTIYSLMAKGKSGVDQLLVSQNPFRDKMLKADITKEFRLNVKAYLEAVDFFLMDLLEERYGNMSLDGIVVTKSEGYFENTDIQGTPISVDFETWKESMDRFMELLLDQMDAARIIMVEHDLCGRYGKMNAPKYEYRDQEYIHAVNEILRLKYSYVKSAWPEITVISHLPEDLRFTDADHIYGCVPEHANYGAYSYMAQKIAEAVREAKEC